MIDEELSSSPVGDALVGWGTELLAAVHIAILRDSVA